MDHNRYLKKKCLKNCVFINSLDLAIRIQLIRIWNVNNLNAWVSVENWAKLDIVVTGVAKASVTEKSGREQITRKSSLFYMQDIWSEYITQLPIRFRIFLKIFM